MALIRCVECGKEISDKAEKCPNCGCPVSKEVSERSSTTYEPVKEQGITEATPDKSKWSTGKLVIGIISTVLFLLMTFQSCAAGTYNALNGIDDGSGSIGFICALLILISGIVGIATKSSLKKAGSIWCTVLYWIMAFFGYIGAGTYSDLKVWAFVAFAFGLFHLLSIMKNKQSLIISAVLAGVYFLFISGVGAITSTETETTVMRADEKTINNAETEKKVSEPIESDKEIGIETVNTADNTINITTENCTMVYTGFNVAADYDGNPCVIIYYDFTNNSDEATSALALSLVEVFQNGVQCDSAFYLPDEEDASIDNYSKQVQSGVTINVAQAFEISSWDDITIEASEAFSWEDLKDTMILQIK